jgi:hypothetical protein
MDFVDMDSAKFAEYAGGGPMRWVHGREAEKLFAFERATAARADLSLFVSDAEAALFRAMAPKRGWQGSPTASISTSTIRRQAFPRIEAPARPLIVFTGRWIIAQHRGRRRFRRRRDAVHPPAPPDRHFAIVGRNPPPAVLRLASGKG